MIFRVYSEVEVLLLDLAAKRARYKINFSNSESGLVQNQFQSIQPSTAKSKCCCSIWQRKGPGTKSISVIAKGAWYKINCIGLQLY